MADQNSPIQQIVAAANADLRINENFDAASPAMLYGRDARTASGLTWGCVGGRWAGALVPSGTIALAASTTNRIVASRSTGAVSLSAGLTQWNDVAGYLRLYEVDTGPSTVTAYRDWRQAYGGSGAGSAVSWDDLEDKPAVIAAGSTEAQARDVIDVPSNEEMADALSGKQDALVSATNIKTINGESLLGSGNLVISGGSGSLAGFTASLNTTAPNATIPAALLLATGSADNIDVVLQPKGIGGLLTALPDNTTVGGNKRGAYAVDLQTYRGAADQVASGIYSVIAGGKNNKATGSASFVAGSVNISSGEYAACFGQNNTASGSYSYARGDGNVSSGNFGSATGRLSSSRSLQAARAHSCGGSLGEGAYQHLQMELRGVIDADEISLTADGLGKSGTNHYLAPPTSVCLVDVRIVARTQSGDFAAWTGQVCVSREAAASSVSLNGFGGLTKVASGGVGSLWTATVVADAGFGSLDVRVTGSAEAYAHASCHLSAVEMVRG